jgi:hypothetical protein
MRRIQKSFFLLPLVLYVSCGSKVTLPISTSLGNLTKIEKKEKVNTNKDPVSPKSGEVVYLLTFEGKKEYEVKGVAVPELISMTGGLTDDSNIRMQDFSISASPGMASGLNLPLLDSSGKEFAPVFFGTQTADGVISNNGMRFNGSVTGRNGKPWITTGKFDFPESKVTVVYVVPDGATLTIKDGGKKHAIN